MTKFCPIANGECKEDCVFWADVPEDENKIDTPEEKTIGGFCSLADMIGMLYNKLVQADTAETASRTETTADVLAAYRAGRVEYDKEKFDSMPEDEIVTKLVDYAVAEGEQRLYSVKLFWLNEFKLNDTYSLTGEAAAKFARIENKAQKALDTKLFNIDKENMEKSAEIIAADARKNGLAGTYITQDYAEMVLRDAGRPFRSREGLRQMIVKAKVALKQK